MTESLIDKLPPQNLEAERSVLGGCLLDTRMIDEAQMIIGPEMFYSDSHRKVCAAVWDMHNAGKHDLDAVTLSHELEKREQLESVGGPTAIMRILEAVPHAAHVVHYAGIVRECWVKRRVIDACTESLRDAHDPAVPVEDLLSDHDRATQGLLETGVAAEDIAPVGVMLSEAFSQTADTHTGVMTGLLQLDEMTGGMRGGNLILIAARASVGKTACGLTVALDVARRGHPVLFFSLEMGRLEVAERLLSLQSQVPAFALRKNLLEDEHYDWLKAAREALNEIPLFVDDRGDQSVTRMSAAIRLYRRRHKIELVVVDYLQLVEPDDVRVNREQQVARIARRIKGLSRSVNLPVVVLCQLNRELEKATDKRPKLSYLRESGALEQEADQVWLLYREDYHRTGEPGYAETGDAELILAKNRNGPTGTVSLKWDKQTMRFFEPDQADIWQDPAMQQQLEAWK